MRHLSHAAAVCSALAVAALSCAPLHAASLRINVANVPDNNGKLGVQLVDANGFANKAQPIAAVLHAPSKGNTLVVLPNVAPGRYAVRVMHDRNGNGDLDSNLIGMPTEPYGFSNDAAGSFGPPDFDDAAFEMGGSDLTITVRLQ